MSVAAIGGTVSGSAAFAADPDAEAGRPATTAQRPPATAGLPPLAEARQHARDRADQLSDRVAAERRARSKRAFRDLSRAQAREVLLREFPKLFGLELGPRSWLPENGELLKHLSDRSALVRDGERTAVVSSTAPISIVEDGQRHAVDLELERRGERFATRRGAVSVEVPKSLSAFSRLEGQVGIALLTGAADVEPELHHGRLLWPNAGTDLDVVALGTPGGLESFYMLRSVDSPENLRLRFDLPDGATVARLMDGGVAIWRDGARIASIPAPLASDVDGRNVNVAYAVDGDELVLRVDHRDADLRYPVAVDPEVVWEQNWRVAGHPATGWNYAEWYAAFDHGYGDVGAGNGLNTWKQSTYGGGYLPLNAEGQWYYGVPGNSYITRGHFHYVRWWLSDSCIFMGFYRHASSTTGAGWVGDRYSDCRQGGTQNSGDYAVGPMYTHSTTEASHVVAMSNIAAYHGGGRGFILTHWGAVTLYYSDNTAPQLTENTGHRSEWHNPTRIATSFNVKMDDAGVGLKTLDLDGDWSSSIWKPYTSGCTGNFNALCGRWIRWPNQSYSTVPDGSWPLYAIGRDLIGRETKTQIATARIDKVGPSLDFTCATPRSDDVSGRHGQVIGSAAVLCLKATDGSNTSSATRRSGVRNMELLIDGTVTRTWSNGDTFNGTDSRDLVPGVTSLTLSEGRHTVLVRTRDYADNESSRSFDFLVDRDVPHTDDVRPGYATDRWHAGALQMIADGSDHGAGLRRLVVETPTGSGPRRWTSADFPCTPSYSSRCPTGPNLLGPVNWSFEQDANGWQVAPASYFASASSTAAAHGARHGVFARTANADTTVDGPRVAASAGEYMADAFVANDADAAPADVAAELAFYNASGTLLTRTRGSVVTERGSSVAVQPRVRAIAPTGAATAQLRIVLLRGTTGGNHTIDAARLQRVDAGAATRTTSFNVSDANEGRQAVLVFWEDATGQRSKSLPAPVLVDRSRPTIDEPTGELWTRRDEGISGPASVTVTARDGDPFGTGAARRSGVQRIEVRVKRQSEEGDGTLQEPTPTQGTTCQLEGSGQTHTDSCPMTRSYTFVPTPASYGPHTITFSAFDHAGNPAGTRSFTFRVVDVFDPVLAEPVFVPLAPAGWTDRYEGDVTATATDPGAGVQRIELTEPLLPPHGDRTRSEAFTVPPSTEPCDGTLASPCPPAGSKTFAIDTDGYRQGIVSSSLVAVDAAGNRSAARRYDLKVDRDPPAVAMSGALADRFGEATPSAGVYRLDVRATDGDRDGGPEAQRSGVESLEVQLKAPGSDVYGRVAYEEPACEGDSCAAQTAYDHDTAGRPDGRYDVRVIAVDRLGHRRVEDRAFIQDTAPPEITEYAHDDLPTGWTARARPVVRAKARDEGVGMKRLRLSSSRGWDGPAKEAACAGNVADPCPRELEAAGEDLRYDTDTIPFEGEIPIAFAAVDALGKAATRDATLKLDRSPPDVTPSGRLRELAGKELFANTYPLTIEAKDGVPGGTPAEARSGVKSIDVRVDGQQPDPAAMHREQPCDGGSCSMTLDWSLRGQDYEPGSEHTISVTATDQLGHVSQPITWTVKIADIQPLITEEELVEESQLFREDWPFRTDEPYIRSLINEPAYTPARETHGVPLTPAEVDEVMEQSTVGESAGSANAWGESNAPETYSGTYQSREGLVFVGFTADGEQRLEELKQVFPYPDKLRLFDAEHTRAALQAQMEEIWRDASLLATLGIDVRSVGLHIQGNRVEVGVPAPTPTQQLVLQTRYGSDVVLVTDMGTDFQEEFAPGPRTRYSEYDPILGGLGITRTDPSGPLCTTGFTVRFDLYVPNTNDTVEDLPGFTTAGHCDRSGNQRWYLGNEHVGLASKTEYDSDTDADVALLEITAGRGIGGRIYYSRGRSLYVDRFHYGKGDDSANQYVCKSGAGINRNSCGRITRERYDYRYGERSILRGQRTVSKSMKCNRGDSGASVVSPVRRATVGVGMHSGQTGDGDTPRSQRRCFFTGTGNAAAALRGPGGAYGLVSVVNFRYVER